MDSLTSHRPDAFELPPAQGTPRYVQTSPDPDLGALYRAVVRRKMALLGVFAGFVALVMLATLLTPKTYMTEVKLIAGNPNAPATSVNGGDTALPVLNALLAASGVQSAETYAELFQETPVAQQVIADLNLHATPQALLSHVAVKPVTNTSILRLQVKWSDPATSAAIANDFARVFVERERELVSSQATAAVGYLSKQIPVAERKMRRAEAALAKYSARHSIADINTQTQSTLAALANIESKIGQAEADRQQAQAQLASVTAAASRTTSAINGGTAVQPNPVAASLKTKLAEVSVQLRAAQQQYTAQHPTVIALKDQQNQLEREISTVPATIVANSSTVPNPVYQQLTQQAAGYRAQAAADTAALSELVAQRARLAPRIGALPAQTALVEGLKRKVKLAQDVYTALQQKYNDATIARTTALSNVTITQPAMAGMAVKTPNLLLNLLVGTLLGAIVALGSVLAIDYFDNSIKDDRDIERELPALPVLANIPRLQAQGRAALPSWLRALSVESFLQLVTSLRYASDHPLRTLAITSPAQGDGKSTVALNVAAAMADVEGKVLLIDADLRHPTLHAKLGLGNDRGLSEILVGSASLHDVVKTTQHPGLDLIPSGTLAPNPMKLLQSRRMDEMLAEALRFYRTVILDTPAMNPIFDAAVLSTKADGTVLVVAAGSTDVRATKRALARLESVGVRNVVGIVLNKATPQARDFSHYYLETEAQPVLQLEAKTA